MLQNVRAVSGLVLSTADPCLRTLAPTGDRYYLHTPSSLNLISTRLLSCAVDSLETRAVSAQIAQQRHRVSGASDTTEDYSTQKVLDAGAVTQNHLRGNTKKLFFCSSLLGKCFSGRSRCSGTLVAALETLFIV
jgi:hypothetical protein